MLRMPLFIILVALVYLVEVLSVIFQVGYFKLTEVKDYLGWLLFIIILSLKDGRRPELYRFLYNNHYSVPDCSNGH